MSYIRKRYKKEGCARTFFFVRATALVAFYDVYDFFYFVHFRFAYPHCFSPLFATSFPSLS